MLDDILGLSENMTDLKDPCRSSHGQRAPVQSKRFVVASRTARSSGGSGAILRLLVRSATWAFRAVFRGRYCHTSGSCVEGGTLTLQIAASDWTALTVIHVARNMRVCLARLCSDAWRLSIAPSFSGGIDAEPDDMLEFPHEMIRQVTYDSDGRGEGP